MRFIDLTRAADYLLFVEDGTIILIGATTENPYFEVNSALISRSIIFELKPLDKEDIKTLLLRAVTDVERGFGSYKVRLHEDALSSWQTWQTVMQGLLMPGSWVSFHRTLR